MTKSQIALNTINSIFQAAFGNTPVPDKSDPEKYRLKAASEDIYYWVYNAHINRNFYIIQDSSPANVKKMTGPLKEKTFLFFLIDGEEEYIFSIEIADLLKDNVPNQTISLFEIPTLTNIKAQRADILRVPIYKQNIHYYDAVAIKIGPKANRNYSPLIHYIVSSDNRTYNHVIRTTTKSVPTSILTTNNNNTDLPRNLLVYGAPGTGKSHFLDKKVKETGGVQFNGNGKPTGSAKPGTIIDTFYKANSNFLEAIKEYYKIYVTRVTFYEDYSYENFIGCYKPVIDPDATANVEYDGKSGTISEEKITYEFVNGPFIDTYIKSKNDSYHNYFLIIEELNRAKAATVFGDMFQLLDRNENGESEYEIKPDAALNKYLENQLDKYDGVMKLPSNMYILATMNSADQGVFPLDSAFKRRWSQMYMDIDIDPNNAYEFKLTLPSKDDHKNREVKWNDLRQKINRVILSNEFDEDRCIGFWYFSEEEIKQINDYFNAQETDRINMVNPLIDKLLNYLRQDLFRRKPKAMFNTENGNDNGTEGLSMSDIRRRVRDNTPIDELLNIEKLDWKD
jgi:hypothetical protein